MQATLVSVLVDGTEIRHECKYNPITFNVSDIKSTSLFGLATLEKEYLQLPDGSKIEREDFTIDFDCD